MSLRDTNPVVTSGDRVRRSLEMTSWTNTTLYVRDRLVSELNIKDPDTCTHDEDDNVCTDCYHEWATDYEFTVLSTGQPSLPYVSYPCGPETTIDLDQPLT